VFTIHSPPINDPTNAPAWFFTTTLKLLSLGALPYITELISILASFQGFVGLGIAELKGIAHELKS